jgi:hypothetical protein
MTKRTHGITRRARTGSPHEKFRVFTAPGISPVLTGAILTSAFSSQARLGVVSTGQEGSS